jgi:hypothetical protein
MSFPAKEVPILEKRMPFNWNAEHETEIVRQMTEVQSVGFGSRATHVRLLFSGAPP